MEKSEITDLLNWAKCGDRWVDNTRPGVEFWHAAIGGETWLTPGLARAAVIAHYREETRTVMVADVLALAGELRRDRLSRVRMPDLPAGVASDPALYEAAYAAAESAILAGGDPAAAMTATIAARRAELNGSPS